MQTIRVSEKVKGQAISETQRGYQSGVATLCADGEGKAFVVVEASGNWSFQNEENQALIDLSDTNGHGGYIAAILGGDSRLNIEGHSDILQFWETKEGREAKEEYEKIEKEYQNCTIDGKEYQRRIDILCTEYSTGLFTSDDAQDDIWAQIVEDVERDGEYEIEVID